jgi:hypothetical protein
MAKGKADQKYLNLFREFVGSVSLKPGLDRYHVSASRVYGKHNAFLGWPYEPQQELLRHLGIKYPSVSMGGSKKVLQSAVVSLFEDRYVSEDAAPDAELLFDELLPLLDPSAVETKAQQVLDVLSSQVRQWILCVPLRGIDLMLPINIFDGTVYPRNGGPLADMIGASDFPDHIRAIISKTYEDASAYCVVSAEGDSQGAEQQAREKAWDVIHILRFFLALMTQDLWDHYEQIRLVGEPEVQGTYIFGYYKTDDAGDRPQWNQTIGPVHPIILDAEVLGRMEEAGLREIEQSFAESSGVEDSIAARIRRAISWYSLGVVAYRPNSKFVSYAIALESLLTDQLKADPKESWGGITQKLAERCAFLLCGTLEDRKETAKRVRALYMMRSKVVHSGSPVSHENLHELQHLVFAAIQVFARRRFGKWDEFTGWVKNEKYGVCD